MQKETVYCQKETAWMKRSLFLSLVLILVLLTASSLAATVIPVNGSIAGSEPHVADDISDDKYPDYQNHNKWHSYWQYWSQGASSIGPNNRGNACFMVAQAKLLVEAGLRQASKDFNPDVYIHQSGYPSSTWEYSNYASIVATANGYPASSLVGLTSNNQTDANTIMDYLRQGYGVILHKQNHFTYVWRAASLEHGTPVISDSSSTYSWSGSLCYTLLSGSSTYYEMHVYKLFPSDTTPPTISNVQVTNVTNAGYTVTCTVSDNVGVTQVLFPSWTLKNDQDDIGEWRGVDVNSGANESRTVSFTVKSSDHNNETGVYRTHIYAYDAARNTASAAAPDVTVPEPGYTLSVASYLNGTKTSGAGCGTFDVYINGTRVKDDTDSYSGLFTDAATYTINDIRAADGKVYKGNLTEWTGTISGANKEIGLHYETCAGLNIRFMLDGVESASCEGYAVFDMQINGQPAGTDLTSYSEVFEDSTAQYEISSITCEDRKVFVDYPDNQPTSGTISRETRTITLTFISEYEPSEDWQVMTTLPEAYDPDACEIQYKNTYRTTSRTSPGAEWTFLEVASVQYETDGGTYTSATPLSTSETRRQADHYYFHYCGDEKDLANSTNWSNSKNKPLPNFHVRRDFDNVHIYQTLSDDGRAVYWLKLNGTNWDAYCPSYDASGTGSTMWYEEYVYQNYKPYNMNTYVKESDWTAEPDPAASSVTYRIRAKRVTVTLDPNGGTFLYDSIEGFAGQDIILYAEEPVRSGYRFLYWADTQNFDGEGTIWLPDGSPVNTKEDMILYAQWEMIARLELPESLTVIEEEAFAGSSAVIIDVPDSCTTIGHGAFRNCTAAEEIHIPASASTIELDAFDGCTNLTIYAPAGSVAIRVAKYNDIPYVEE